MASNLPFGSVSSSVFPHRLGVPTGKVRYDNLKAAVASVIGSSRQWVEADRWTAFRSHYGALYCQPGIQGAHEWAASRARSSGSAATTPTIHGGPPARKTHGDPEATRALIEVPMLHLQFPHDHVVASLAAALNAGALTADAVALEARKREDATDGPVVEPSAAPPAPRAVRSLTERRLRAQLPADDRPLPTVDKYDQLLPSRRDNPNEGAAP